MRAHPIPAADELWLSRPPYLLVAHVLEVDPTPGDAHIEYELLDHDGSSLAEAIEPLDQSWWEHFQPLVRREG